jgi:hypothetical protein
MTTKVKPLFVKYSKLTLDGKDFQCEATSVGITSSGGGEQTLTTLCPDGSFSEQQSKTYSLTVTLAQDVENIDSFLMWCMIHDTETVDFVYYPKTDGQGKPVGYGFKGQVVIAVPDTIGGSEAGSFATAQVSFGLQGRYSVVDAAGQVVPELDALNITKVAFGPNTNFADLAALKADAVNGDGKYPGAAFNPGEYVYLTDKSKAHYASNAWSVGAAT